MARRGVTLPELLVGLPLAALVGSLAVGLLLTAMRHARRLSDHLLARQQLEGAQAILSADLSVLRADDLQIVSDTMMGWTVPRWIGVVCRLERPMNGDGSLVVAALPIPGSNPALPTPVLDLEVWERDSDWLTRPPHPVRRRPSRVEPAPRPDACPPVGGRPVPQWRVVWRLDSLWPTRPEVGFPVVAREPVRFRHYQSAGRWWLGRSHLTERGWSGLQPVAGPLASPADGGMRAIVTPGGGVSTARSPMSARLRVLLRGVDRRGHPIDSLRFDAALARAESSLSIQP